MAGELGDGIKTLLLAGVGAIATTAEKSKEIIDDLAKKGEITVDQAKNLNDQLKQDIGDKVANTVSAGTDATKKILDQIEDLTVEEIVKLKQKIDDMEKNNEETNKDSE